MAEKIKFYINNKNTPKGVKVNFEFINSKKEFKKIKETETIVIKNNEYLIEKILLYKDFENLDDEYYFYEDIRETIANTIKKAKELKKESIEINISKKYIDENVIAEIIREVVFISYLTNYSFDKYKKKKDSKIKNVFIASNFDFEKIKTAINQIIKETETIAINVNEARNIGNEPSNIINPTTFENLVKKIAKSQKWKIKILHEKELIKKGLNGIYFVGKASKHKPRLIILEYNGNKKSKEKQGLVGKTVCYDAGGYNLKPGDYGLDMKFDKLGGIYSLFILKALSELRVKKNIVLALPVVENLINEEGYKPRDIIKMYNGLNIEVGNTDAEGRIILADALSYMEKNYKPKKIISIATLTGAIGIALGSYATGLFTKDYEFAAELEDAGAFCFERLWQLPMFREYDKQLKSNYAEISNIGGYEAGSITAAWFLNHFVEKIPYAHLDIAYTGWKTKGHPNKPYFIEGATGVPIRTIVDFFMEND